MPSPTFGIKLSAKPDAAQREKDDVHGALSLARAMFVDTFGVRATDFDIDPTMQDTLFRSGRKTASKFLAGWDFEEYVETYRSGGEDRVVSSEPEPMGEV